jgi:hypothetical protein
VKDDGKGFEERAFGVSDVIWDPDRPGISILLLREPAVEVREKERG